MTAHLSLYGFNSFSEMAQCKESHLCGRWPPCLLRYALYPLTIISRSLRHAKIKYWSAGSLRTTQAVTGHRGEPLLDEIKVLRDWLRQRPNDGSDFVFNSQKGGRLDRSQFFRLFRAIAADAGLPPEKRHPHVLKHSIASHLISANVNLALVKQALGHKSINSTMRYIATTDKAASQATVTALMRIF
jgi:integrase